MKAPSSIIPFILIGGIFTFGLHGCARESETRKSSAQEPGTEARQAEAQSPEGLPRQVVMAQIVSDSLTSEKPLVAQYVSDNPEKKPFVCDFRWYVDGALVNGVSGNVLDPSYFRKGARVEAEVVPTLDGVKGQPCRTPAVIVKNAPPVVTAIEFSPLLIHPGTRITVMPAGKDSDNDAITYSCQWEVNGMKVPGATAVEFDTGRLKKRDVISVTVTPFDGEDSGVPVRSPKSVVVANTVPEITSTPPSGLENGVYTYQVSARDPDGDPLSYSLVKAPEGMTIDRSTGLIRWEAPKQLTDKQEVAVKVAADDGDGGLAYQEFSLFLEMK